MEEQSARLHLLVQAHHLLATRVRGEPCTQPLDTTVDVHRRELFLLDDVTYVHQAIVLQLLGLDFDVLAEVVQRLGTHHIGTSVHSSNYKLYN